MGISAFISGIFGVTEPAIYGITLPRKKPFIASCIASGVGGAIMGFAGTKSYMVGGLGIFAIPSKISPKGIDTGFYGNLVAIVVALVLGLLITLLMDKSHKDEVFAEPVVEDIIKTVDLTEETLVSPLTGSLQELSGISDEVFASGAMGNGVAILPTEGKLFAPTDGEVTLVFPTGHAVGMKTNAGAEVLMHIGMDTVQLDGQFFETHVEKGLMVTKGTLLVTFDIEQIKAAGYEVITPMIVTNTSEYNTVKAIAEGNVTVGDAVLELK